MKFWLDGEWKTENPSFLLAHSLHYGSAIFEGLRFYKTERGPAIFRLQEHIDRFFHSAKVIGVSLPYSYEGFREAIVKSVAESGLEEGYIRPLGFFGAGDMELYPSQAPFHIAIFVWPWKARLGVAPLRLKVSSLRRTPPEASTITAKIAGHYGNSFLARCEATKAGYNEALLLDAQGYIAEGSGANFFGVQKECLVTPPKQNIFPGITRDAVFEIAKSFGIPCYEKPLFPHEIFEEAFLAGTAVELVPILSIDRQQMQSSYGPITRKMREAYSSAVRGNFQQKWVTYVDMCHC